MSTRRNLDGWPVYPMHTCKCQALAGGQIVHCAEHAAAPALRAALEEMSVVYGWHGASVGAHPRVKRAMAAIRAAKGE
jgi:hypothetical protein